MRSRRAAAIVLCIAIALALALGGMVIGARQGMSGRAYTVAQVSTLVAAAPVGATGTARVRATATLLSAPTHGQAAVLVEDDPALPNPEGLIVSVQTTAQTYLRLRLAQLVQRVPGISALRWLVDGGLRVYQITYQRLACPGPDLCADMTLD